MVENNNFKLKKKNASWVKETFSQGPGWSEPMRRVAGCLTVPVRRTRTQAGDEREESRLVPTDVANRGQRQGAASQSHRNCLRSNAEGRGTGTQIQSWLNLESVSRKCQGLVSHRDQPVSWLINEKKVFCWFWVWKRNWTHVCRLGKPLSFTLDLGRKTI